MRSSALVTKLKTLCGPIDPLVTGFPADPILPAQSADCIISCCDFRNELFSLFHNSLCLPRHLTHFLCLSDVFILAKTVTYVSSLPVTYVTTLYISSARLFPPWGNNVGAKRRQCNVEYLQMKFGGIMSKHGILATSEHYRANSVLLKNLPRWRAADSRYVMV